ncbi:chaperone SurA precursor [mine drainage metagenome]|uniref:Chaperone SurA n=1 Tax=mine drainage metagenome TaxID=410659 RepID=A0A1J5S822_9ZZZZ
MAISSAFRRLLALCLFGAVLVLGINATAQADEVERVAAVVNDQVITLRDLEMRIRMVLLSSNQPDTVENRSRVASQVLHRLVDEYLQLQAAQREKISVSDADVENGFATIEQQNNMPRGAMVRLLDSKGIDPETMRQQIRAEIAWARVVRRVMAANIKVGEEEVDARLQTIKENMGKPEYLAAEIFLPIDNPAHRGEVQALASKLIDEMRQGAPFPALARQFSQTGGGSGGDLGWVSQGMLDDKIMSALAGTEPGHLAVVALPDGIHILLLRQKRIVGAGKPEPTFDLGVVSLTTLPSASPAERQEQEDHLRKAVAAEKSCDNYPSDLKSLPSADWRRPGKLKPSEIPHDILELIEGLPVMQLSKPLVTPDARRYYVICEREDPQPGGLPSRDEIRQRLEDEHLEVEARRYLRDLRRSAFVEIRL